MFVCSRSPLLPDFPCAGRVFSTPHAPPYDSDWGLDRGMPVRPLDQLTESVIQNASPGHADWTAMGALCTTPRVRTAVPGRPREDRAENLASFNYSLTGLDASLDSVVHELDSLEVAMAAVHNTLRRPWHMPEKVGRVRPEVDGCPCSISGKAIGFPSHARAVLKQHVMYMIVTSA